MIKIQFFFHEFFLNELLIIVLRVLISIFHIKIIKNVFFLFVDKVDDLFINYGTLLQVLFIYYL